MKADSGHEADPLRAKSTEAQRSTLPSRPLPAYAEEHVEIDRVLVIDDDASHNTLEAVLVTPGSWWRRATAERLDLRRSGTGRGMTLTYYRIPDMDGMQVLERLRAADPSVPVLMLTAHGSERVAVAAMKAGDLFHPQALRPRLSS